MARKSGSRKSHYVEEYEVSADEAMSEEHSTYASPDIKSEPCYRKKSMYLQFSSQRALIVVAASHFEEPRRFVATAWTTRLHHEEPLCLQEAQASESVQESTFTADTFSAQFNDLLVVKFLDSTHVMYFTVVKLLKAGFPLRVQNLQVMKLTPSKARKV